MKTKNKNWIRLTTSIVIISLLYQNILLAEDKHLAPKSNKKDEMQAVMLCETIEKGARYGKPIERIYLDDILIWAESSGEGFSGCWFETLPHEIRIHLASDNIMIRYFDPSNANSISGFKTEIIGPRLHRQIIHTVKALSRIRTKSQTALFTMLNGVLRDFMPIVNASLAAVVLSHYPHKDASFAERLYDAIQRSSGLSSLEKLQEFNRLYPDDSIDVISAIMAEANELKKALSREVGISAAGQKLLELFQHDLAFTISVDSPDYIKKVMESNPSLLNAQGLLVDTLGNTGEADYDKFSHIDKVLGAYPDVKNVFLIFDATSEIRQARKIADRLKTQGKRVHVIGIVYPMPSESAREALKIALRQAGYSGGIDLDTLSLPDQSFDSLSKTLVDAGADIVLSGLSSNLSQIKEIVNPPALPFNHIITSQMRLKREELYNNWILKYPYSHLVKCRIGEGIGERFKALDIKTIALGYNVVCLRDESGNVVYILAVSEIGEQDQILQTWAIIDNEGRFIELEHIKHSTLPAEYIMDEDSYERLARFTYAFTESGGRPALGISSKWAVTSIGHEWIDLHAVKGTRETNRSCGTVCESGHEGSYMALDEQLKRQFDELQKILSLRGRGKGEGDLSEEEADRALVEYAKGFGIEVTYEQLREYRREIKATDTALGQIEIFFFIPETGTELFWVGEDYAGGHVNRKGTRIHISLPVILDKGIEAGTAIAKHELAHIHSKRHEEDEGVRIINRILTSPEEQKKIIIYSIKNYIRQLRYLYERGILKNVAYPFIGIDCFPAIFTVTIGLNDYDINDSFFWAGLEEFINLDELCEITGKSDAVKRRRTEEFIIEGNYLNPEEVVKVINEMRQTTRNVTLFIKGSSVCVPIHIARFRGFSYTDFEKKWLKTIVEKAILPGDYVILWNEDVTNADILINNGFQEVEVDTGIQSCPLSGIKHIPSLYIGGRELFLGLAFKVFKKLSPSEISKARQQAVAERFVNVVKKPTMKEKDSKVVLALDTDIGNMTQFEIGELLKQIRDVSSLLGDIEFVAGKGDELTGLIEAAKVKIKTDNIAVVVVTKREKKNFDSSYYITRVDDSRLDPSSYVPILELLTFALLINLGDNDVLLQEIYKELTGNELTSELKGQIKNGIFAIPLPPSEKISSDFYNTSMEVLKSA